jgi:hypothetical protein
MVSKCKLFKNIPLHLQNLNCKENVYELEDHVGEKALTSNWLPKLGPIKIILPISLLNCLLERI